MLCCVNPLDRRVISHKEGKTMAKIKYDGSTQFKPISPWGYIGYTILFAIPIVGLICLIVFALSSTNINRRNLARSYWCAFLVVILICIGSGILAYFNVGSVREDLVRTFPGLRKIIQSIDTAPSQTTSKSINTTRSNESTNKKQTSPSTSRPTANVTKAPTTAVSSKSTGVRKEVKAAIDSYEEFFNEYAAFMKKYSSSSNPLSMLADYTTMMTKYTSTMEKWEKFDKNYDLNDAELKYYTEATLRINNALLSVY